MNQSFSILLKYKLNIVFRYIQKSLTFLKKKLLPIAPVQFNEFHASPFDYHVRDEKQKCYNYFKKYFNDTILITEEGIRELSISRSINNDKNLENFYLEFGVFTGESINYFSKFVKKIYGFDSFVGLKEDFLIGQMSKGDFNLNGKIPYLKSNVTPIKGWVQDTLPDFLKKFNPKINFVHMDLDTYDSSKFTLEAIKPYLKSGCVILFDEFYNFPGWEHGEFKALQEVFKENEFQYMAFSSDAYRVAITIL